MKIQLLNDSFCICKLEDLSQIDLSNDIFFLAKTDSEISLVCADVNIPKVCKTVDRSWRGMRIVGTLDFSLVGILAEISSLLAKAGVPIFAVSTYDTDYVLFKQEYADRALTTLKDNGYEIIQ